MTSEPAAPLVESAQELLLNARRAVALTGAGISTPSGIPDFRSPTSGLWQHVDPMQVASLSAFQRRPQDFYDWIYPLAQKTLAAQPNPAHVALVQMETYGPVRAVITQNIDMLHSKAGSKRIIEVHGHLREMTCLRCFEIVPAAAILDEFLATGEVPHCHCDGVLKPNVILFGEQLPVRAMQAAKRETIQSDLMLVAGSSLDVSPAGDLPVLARQTGSRLIIVNLEPTHADDLADVVIRGDVVEILPQLAAPFLPPVKA